MKVLDPGHSYALLELDTWEDVPYEAGLRFVKREGPKYPGNEGSYSGTTLQEVLRACCDRLRYVSHQGDLLGQMEYKHNLAALNCIREAIRFLEIRAALRHGRNPDGLTLDEAEFGQCCSKCNHVGCTGGCH